VIVNRYETMARGFVGVLDIHHVGKFFTGTHQHTVFLGMPFRNSRVSPGAKVPNIFLQPINILAETAE
ncbi:MAG: hypothetical protein ABSC55_27830, partial [Syntrophorhabdales bacterium]